MKNIVIPCKEYIASFVVNLVGMHIHSNGSNVAVSHLLATQAPSTNLASIQRHSERKVISALAAIEQEMLVWIHGMITAGLDDRILVNSKWGPYVSRAPYNLDNYLQKAVPAENIDHWDYARLELLCTKCVEDIWETIEETVSGTWALWDVTGNGFDLLLSEGEDFRIVDWNRRHKIASPEKRTVTPHEISDDSQAVSNFLLSNERSELEYSIRRLFGSARRPSCNWTPPVIRGNNIGILRIVNDNVEVPPTPSTQNTAMPGERLMDLVNTSRKK